jgi:hypothetical protein
VPDNDDEGNVRPFRPPTPRPGRGNGQQETAHVLANQALELRMGGASYSQIAQALGMSNKGTAHDAVRRALREDDERVAPLRDQYRTLSLARYERLLRTWWPRAVADDLDAAKYVNTLLEREARLLGLDAPKQVQISGGILQAADDALLRLRETVLGEVTHVHDDTEHG